MDVHVGPGGVVLESNFSGAPADGLELHVEREEIGANAGGFVRLAEFLSVDGTELVYLDSAVQSGATYRYRLVDDNGAYEFRSEAITVPAMRAALHPGVPNPFNPSTTLVFEVPATAGSLVPTRLEIFDAVGRRVRVLQDGPLSPGTHRTVWNGRDENGLGVGSGVYYARLLCAGEQRSTKLTLVK
jgi:hypothetical protein